MSEKNMDQYEEEISLIDLLNILKKNAKLIIGVFLIIGILGSIVGLINYKNGKVKETIISYNFSEITNGKNPDGTIFNYNEIVSPAVLSIVEDELKLSDEGIARADLLKAIRITPIVPSFMSTKIENDLKDGVSTKYTASNYKLEVSLLKNVQLTESILKSLLKNYQLYYQTTHKSSINIGEVPEISELSYLELGKYLTNKISSIESTIEAQKDQGYVSKRYGIGFKDILAETNLFRGIYIPKLERMVTIEGISKNKEEDIKEIDQSLFMLGLEREKKLKTITSTKEVLKGYKLTPNTTIAGDQGVEASVSGDNSNIKTYSKLNENIISVQDDVSDIDNKITVLKVKRERIKNTAKEIKNQDITNEYKTRVNSIVKDSNNILEDYNNQLVNDYVSQASPVTDKNNSKGLLIIAISLVLGLIAGIFLAFVKEFFDQAKLEEKKQKRIK